MSTIKTSKDGTALVDHSYFWTPISLVSPILGSKVQVINREAGVATTDSWSLRYNWSHWAPLPKFLPLSLENQILLTKDKRVKADIAVNSGALILALNSLRRGTASQREIAQELEATAERLK